MVYHQLNWMFVFAFNFFTTYARLMNKHIFNPLYTDTRYHDKFRYNDNLNVTEPSLNR